MADGTRYAWGQAYRDGSLTCNRARVTLDRNDARGAQTSELREALV